MEMETPNKQQEQDAGDSAQEAAKKEEMVSGTGSYVPDEDIEPVLDEADMEELHLDEADLDNIEWEPSVKQDEDLTKDEA